MKLILRCFFFSTLFLLFSYSASSAPAKNVDTVTMSFEDFLKLREKAKDKEIKRSKLFSYEKAILTGKGFIKKSEYFINFNSNISVTSHEDRDILVPFLSSDLNLESLTVDGFESTWIKEGKSYKVYIKGSGKHVVKAKFTVKLSAKVWPRSLYLPLIKIPGSRIKIKVPDRNISAEFDRGIAFESALGNEINGYIPSVSGVTIKWLKKNTTKKKVPLKMNATVHTYISLEEKGASSVSEVNFKVLKGETNFFKIRVPSSVDILNILPKNGGKPVSQWFSEKSGDDTIVNIFSSYKQNRSFGVRLYYEKTETKANFIYETAHIKPLKVERFEELIAVGSGSNVEIGEESGEKIERRDVRFLPAEIQRVAKSNALFYYKAKALDFNLKFNVKSHENAPVLKMRVKRVDVDSVITKEGTVMTKIKYSVQNNQEQYLKIQIPEKSKLLSAFLSGKEVQPTIDDDYYLIPITKSTGKTFPVEIAFLTEKKAFSSIGYCSFDLPLKDIPVGELYWNLYTPSDYQPIYFGGNIVRRKHSFFDNIAFFVQNSSETSNVAYAGGFESQNYEYNTKGLRKRFKSKAGYFSKKNESLNNQIKVSIPVTGTKYRFSSYLVNGFSPEISFFYINDSIKNFISFFVSIFMFCFTFITLIFFIERASIPENLKNNKIYISLCGIAFLILVVLMTFSFGIYWWLYSSVVNAFKVFTIYQNRLVSKRMKTEFSGFKRFIADAYIVVLILTLLSSSNNTFQLVFCTLSITFHILLPVLIKILSKILDSFLSIFRAKPSKAVPPALLIIFVLCGSLLFNENAFANKGTVTLSYKTVEKMLKKIEDKKRADLTKIDKDYIFGNVAIKGHISKKYAKMNLSVPVSIISDNYVIVPMFSSDISIMKATFRGRPLSLFNKNNQICFETRKLKGRKGLLKVDLIVPVKEKGGVHEFALNTSLLRGGTVEFGFEKEIKSINLKGVTWQTRTGQKIKAALGRFKTLRGELATFKRENDAIADNSKRVKKLYSKTYTLLSFEDEVATFYSSVRYKILNDQIREFKVSLPDNVTVNEIIGDDLEEWNLLKKEKGVSTYLVKVLYPATGKYDLSIQYEKAIDKSSDFEVPELKIFGVARNEGYIGVEMLSQAEITLKEIDKAKVIDIKELPGIIKEDAYSPFVYALRYIETPYKITFETKRYTNFQMDPAICDRIEYIHVISPEGQMLSQIRMWVRNSRKQFIKVKLPENGKILSTYLDGRSVKPSLGKKGEILLPLKRQSGRPFILEAVYNGGSVDIGDISSFSKIVHPSLDIASSVVETILYVPKDIKLSILPSVFNETQGMRFIGWGASDGLVPKDEISDDLDTEVFNLAPNRIVNNKQQQKALVKEKKIGGTLSIKIDLPKHGRVYSFDTLYVPVNKELVLSFFTTNKITYVIVTFLLVIFFIVTGFLIRYVLIRKNSIRVSFIALNCIFIYLSNMPWTEIITCIVIGTIASFLYNRYGEKIKGKIKAWA
ncbi:MAG: hypothetical protein GY760_11335 [Deltaproteobacteria bacterium]|nr:hypothetical protein [Deltaproteobacteria bacterium]